ncbi:DUF4412 domain-containing protein [Roseomonas sp. NAR14]|uniref:DUF4412 domain-containing protein n=1 Tax=Roseomonas acroporae TaxID=2937791 RepID=A0A9X2BTM2_9PROT|nr:DUF4412 domain-containing protein [Roseomonas acroporae]MCK8783371.1 DUF4412 domain-containing protein [Roseomonas acroporae]
MRRHQTGLIAATLLALAAPALAPAARAQERPPLTPTRDVAVTYRVVGQIPGQPAGAGQGPREMRMSWLTAAGKLRIETGGAGAPSGYMLVDRRNNRALMVVDQQRMVMELPQQQVNGQVIRFGEPNPNARFTRGGNETIAGQGCTNWSFQDNEGTGRACITADGVVLRASGARQGSEGQIEAVQVAYGPQDPSRFEPPSGYQVLNMSEMLRNMPQGARPGR